MKLYKYMTLERGIQVLGDGLLRFTQPTAFNDPFELNPSFDLMSKADLAALPDVPDKPGMKYLTPEALQSMFAAVMPGLQTLMESHAGQEGAYSLRNNDLAQLTLDQKYGVICLSMAHEQRVQVMELCQQEHLKHLEIFQTRLSDDKYELEMHPPIDGRYPPEALKGRVCTAR